MIATGDVIAPDGQISTFAVRKDFLEKNRDVVVRFAMAYLQGVKEFNAAAEDPDKYPDDRRYPRQQHRFEECGGHSRDRTELVLLQRRRDAGGRTRSWRCRISGAARYFHFVEKKVTQDQLFDLSIAKEAKARFDREKPFGN